jgi:hypothetical protein
MTGIRFSRAIMGLAAIALTSSLVACTPEAPPAPTDSATPSASTPTASPTPTSAPTVAPAAATCENLLDATTLEAILSTGFDVNPVNDYVNKIRGEGSPYALFDEYGGIVCPVNNGTRVSELYGYSPISAENQAAQESGLQEAGWVQSSHNGGTLYVDSVPQEGIVFAFYFRNGFWWCGYDAGVIDMIVANSPAS